MDLEFVRFVFKMVSFLCLTLSISCFMVFFSFLLIKYFKLHSNIYQIPMIEMARPGHPLVCAGPQSTETI